MRRASDPSGMGARLAAAAIFAAPFIALLYRAEAGLLVMALALGAVSLLLHDAIGAAPRHAQGWLRLVLGFNIALAGACLMAAAWLLLRN